MARLNLSVPDALYARLEQHRDRVNVSKICAQALERELEMIEADAVTVSSPKVDRLLQRIRVEMEQKEQWRQRGYDDGEEWMVDRASLGEIKQMAEWDEEIDYVELIDELDEDEFPTLQLSNQMDRWLLQDLRELGLENVEPLQRRDGRRKAIDVAEYLRGWHRAVRDMWKEAGPQLRRYEDAP